MRLKAILCVVLFACFIGALCQAEDKENKIPKLTVKGEATIFKPADQIEFSLSVVTQDTSSKKAVKANNDSIRQVIEQLNAMGLTPDEYQTGHFQIQPIYHHPDPKTEREAPSISHYEVTNMLQIKTQKLDLAEQIIGVVVQSGANRLDQMTFSLSDPQAYRDEVIQLATKNALEDASSLAHAAQVRLLRVLSLELDHSQNRFPVPMMMAAKANFDSSYQAPLEIGLVELRATVHVVFEIGAARP